METRHVLGQHVLAVRQGDLALQQVDAIVNAANRELSHGGALALAIARAGGPAIQQESDRWVAEHGPVPTGSCALTSGGLLAARWVIHAVGPIWSGGNESEDELLRSACWQSLELARDLACASLALPAISAGTYGFPKPRCARILVRTAIDWCARHPDDPPREIRCVLYDEPTARLFAAESARRIQPGS